MFDPSVILLNMLFRYLLDRTPTRLGMVRTDFISAATLCDAAYASRVITLSSPLFFIALLKKRLAAATSHFSLSSKSTVQPCLSTAR